MPGADGVSGLVPSADNAEVPLSASMQEPHSSSDEDGGSRRIQLRDGIDKTASWLEEEGMIPKEICGLVH